MSKPKKLGRRPRKPGAVASIVIAVRLTPGEREQWTSAAGDLPLGDWIREVCNREALA